MIAKREIRTYDDSVHIWAGKYRNSHNLLHWHAECELIYAEHGCLEIFCERKTHLLREGETLLVDSEQVHSMRAPENGTLAIVIFFDKEIFSPYFDKHRLTSPKLTGSYPVPELYERLRKIFAERKPFYGAECAAAILTLLLSMFRNEALTLRVDDHSTQSLKKLLDEINEHDEYYTFDDAVRFMHMSPAYFSRYFHEATGSTFSQYLNYVRVGHAIDILKEDPLVSMTEVAARCGFGTIRNFNRAFKALTGYAPRELPEHYLLGNAPLVSETAFNPTVHGCELVESLV